MDNKKIDFYSSGYRMGIDDENTKRLERKIKKEYGEEAAFQFLAGYIAAHEDLYIRNNRNAYKLKSGGLSKDGDFVDAEMIDGAREVVYDPNLRNNSFYGGNGVSPIYDTNGKFNEPPLEKQGKSKK